MKFKSNVIVNDDEIVVIEHTKSILSSNVEDNRISIPTHLVKLVQKAYTDEEGISSVAIFFETEDEFFFTQDDIEEDLETLFNQLLEIKQKRNIFRVEEYNIKTKTTIDK